MGGAGCRGPRKLHAGALRRHLSERRHPENDADPSIFACGALAFLLHPNLREDLEPMSTQGGRRLNIAYVSDAINGGLGGAVVAARYVVDSLRKEHDVVVVGADATGADGVTMSGFQLPLRAMRDNEFVMAIPDHRKLARVVADVDVVHLQFPFWLSFAALTEAHKAGRPVVAAFHIQPENALLNMGIRSDGLAHLVYRTWVKHYYNRADAVVVPSALAQRRLVEHGLVAPSFVISNGVPPDVHPLPHRREPGHEDEFTVLMVGRLAPEKRQEDLIEAVRRSPHASKIRLVIAGAGPREPELRRLTRLLPNGAEIGFVSRNRLLQLLASADLLVHCSEVELEGIVVLEAMGTGLPALVAESRESASSELAIGNDFRYPAGDTAALTAKLDAFIEDPRALEAARVNVRERAEGLRLEKSVEKIVDTYRFVMDKNRSHAA
jgi:glycosyltransferase involved in cell wall biosynthesis